MSRTMDPEKKMRSAILNKEEIIEFLRENNPFIEQQFGVVRIGLFGSCVRGDACEDSDIDIAVEMRDERLFIDDINDSIQAIETFV
jgi:uncharacterized protein